MIPKFRAWDKDHKYMEYTDKNLVVCFSDEGVEVTDHTTFSHSCISMEKFELMQATGVTSIYDDNSTEIYEGDIVKTKSSPHGRFIGCVGNAVSRFEVRGVKQYKGLIDDLDGSYVVIGNKFQNPELLEDN